MNHSHLIRFEYKKSLTQTNFSISYALQYISFGGIMELTKKSVLWAVMSNPTPIGAVVDRLKNTAKFPGNNINLQEIQTIISDLITLDLVVKTNGNKTGVLYRKVPHAMSKLEVALNPDLTEA